jgi:DNA polymerase-3 subunit gamma/tau
MSQTLYRKYRPQSFDELTGQDHIKITLQNQLTSGNIAHAYLFTGPRGVGKTTTARLLAAALNCPDGQGCEPIFNGKDVDVIEIDAASHTSVDNVRENIIENARFTPQMRPYKVYIIDEVHMLSIAAFNALLKILEEPPTKTIFILATTELHKVPATIISRCQRFDFRKISTQTMIARLEGLIAAESKGVDPQVLYDIVKVADGCLRDAESLLGQILGLDEKYISQEQASLVLPPSKQQECIRFLEICAARHVQEGLELIQDLMDQGADLNQFAKELLEIARRVMVVQSAGPLQTIIEDLSQEAQASVERLARLISSSEIVGLIDAIAQRRLQIATSPLVQLPLELVVVQFCGKDEHVQPQKNIQSTPEKKEEVVEKKEEVVEKKEEVVEKKDATSLTLGFVKQKWGALLKKLQEKNPSLVLILKTAEPVSVENGVLTIGYKYPFHKDRIAQSASYDVLIEICTEILGGTPVIEGAVLPDGHISDFIAEVSENDDVEFVADTTPAHNTTPVASEPNEEQLLHSLVQAFGGKIIE